MEYQDEIIAFILLCFILLWALLYIYILIYPFITFQLVSEFPRVGELSETMLKIETKDWTFLS